jgi:two-component system, LuxR family, sensor kinase FixL
MTSQTKYLLMSGILFAGLLFGFLWKQQKQIWMDQFEQEVKKNNAIVVGKLESNKKMLASIVSHFHSSKRVSRKSFQLFVDPLLKNNSFMQALEWVPKVSGSERETYEEKARSEGFSNFQFIERSQQGKMVSAGIREEYFPVYYLEPYMGNQAALGFDLTSNPARLSSLQNSRDSGKPVATSKIGLLQEKQKQVGFLVIYPHYKTENIPLSIAERRKQLDGFVLGVYRIGEMIQQILRPNKGKGLRLVIFEGDQVDDKNLLFGNFLQRSPLETKKQINVLNRQWLIVWQADSNFLGGFDKTSPALLTTVFLFIYILIVSIIAMNHFRTRKIENEVTIRTEELASANKNLKQAQGSMSKSEKKFRRILETAIDPVISIDEKGIILLCNPAAEQKFGYSTAEMVGQNVKMLMPSPYREEHDTYLANYIRTGKEQIIGMVRELEGERKDGSVFPMELSVSEVLDGEQRSFTGIVRDISQLKQAQESVSKSEKKFRRILETAIDPVISIDEKGIILLCNPAAEQKFGYPAAEMVGQNVKMLMPSPYREEHDTYLANYMRTGKEQIIGMVRELEGERKDGSVFPMELSVSEVLDGEQRSFTGIVRDIIQLKQAQESVSKSENKFRRILETAIDPVISIDEKGIILLCNPAAEQEFGYSAVEMVGKNIKMLMPSPYREEHDTYLANYMETGKAQIIGMIRELEGERKDGSVFPMELSVSEVLDGEQRSFTGVVRNITEHKEMIDELKQFAYVTSHDLKAPLRAISNLSQWIEEDLGDDLNEETAENLALLRSRVLRMENLIQGVLQYSRAGSGDPTIMFCKLKEVIDGIIDSIVVPEEFSIQIESDIIGIYADQTQVIQIFTNLLSNAIKHNDKPQGKVRITARECETNKAWIEILVADNGPGIPMQYREKVFQVFQTLQARDKAENTGVGLAIVKKIIEKRGGKIEILDLDVIGTTFKILWPNRTP